mmetsp:Transcript_142550/g.251552  ORF Transcript_142550/g.251552 Transcript_142550/m.251552 type:complete len:243 (+) Transcript_142550:71-799(+)
MRCAQHHVLSTASQRTAVKYHVFERRRDRDLACAEVCSPYDGERRVARGRGDDDELDADGERPYEGDRRPDAGRACDRAAARLGDAAVCRVAWLAERANDGAGVLSLALPSDARAPRGSGFAKAVAPPLRKSWRKSMKSDISSKAQYTLKRPRTFSKSRGCAGVDRGGELCQSTRFIASSSGSSPFFIPEEPTNKSMKDKTSETTSNLGREPTGGSTTCNPRAHRPSPTKLVRNGAAGPPLA